jgi:hypothetical protein
MPRKIDSALDQVRLPSPPLFSSRMFLTFASPIVVSTTNGSQIEPNLASLLTEHSNALPPSRRRAYAST